MIHKLKLLVLFLIIPGVLFAQGKNEKKGDKAFLKGNYTEAIAHFKNIKDINSEVARKIADSYFILGDYDLSEKFYNSIKEEDKVSSDLINLSEIYLANDNFAAAVLFVERAGELGANPNEIQGRLNAIHKLIEIRNENQDLKISQLEIKPRGKCLGIYLLSDGLVYSDTGSGKFKSDKNYQLFIAASKNLEFDSPATFAGKLEPKTDIGAVCISPDGNTMYYTRWYVRKGNQHMEIAIAEKQKGEWVSKESLAFCSRKYSCCYPFLSPDGKTMYFSSDMEGGFGGMDLYVSTQDDGKWTEPKNLGKSINTAKNEIYPRLLFGNQLWFSSDGRGGYGQLDLFFTTQNSDGSWAQVINPGVPYNSQYSDYSILDDPENDIQLFVSDREDAGLRDRIYKLKKQFKERVYILVKDRQSNEFVVDVDVSVRKELENTEIVLANKGNKEAVISFEIPKSEFDKEIVYEIAVKKSGYLNQLVRYSSSNPKKNIEVFLDRAVVKNQFSFVSELMPIAYPNKKIAFKNIYFEKNETDFSADAKQILDELYQILVKFPELGVKINGHCDSKGKEQMNMDISLLKAQKAKKYLEGKGVEASAVEIGAWGEEFILNGCFDDSECSEIEHQENRRLELIFVL